MPGKPEENGGAAPPARGRTLRLTPLGRGAAAAAGITFLAAAVSGNNLLYLLFATLAAAFLLSLALGRLNLRGISAGLTVPGQVFRGSDFTLPVELRKASGFTALGLRLAARGQRVPLERLEPGVPAQLELRYLLPHRGLNRPEDLRLESEFPFGLLRHGRPLAAPELTALPRTREARSASEFGAGVEVLSASTQRRGRSGDLWGVREMRPDEDIRGVNWKLSAKFGRLVAVEYSEPAGSRVTVRLEGGASGPAGEERVEAAAGACRYFIDAGAEVRLATPAGETEFGRGLLHLDRLLLALALAGDGAAARPVIHPDPETGAENPDAALWRRLVLAGCWLTYACLFLVEEFRTPAGALLALPLAAAALARPLRLPRLPGRLWDAATLAVLVHGVFFHIRQAGIMVANTWLVAYMAVYFAFNLADRESRRSALAVFYLAFFLVSGQTISLWYFPAYLACLVFFTAWLAAEWGAGLRPGRGWPGALAPAAAALLALSAAVFAAVPRLEPLAQRNPIVASLGLDKLRARSSAVTGFTNSVTLGYFGELRRSGARVMRVRPLASPPAEPPPLYVRGLAFDTFDGRAWSRGARGLRYRLGGRLFWSLDGSVPLKLQGRLLALPGYAPDPRAGAVEYTLYPMNLAVIFSAFPVGAVERQLAGAFTDYTDSFYFTAPYFSGARYIVRNRPAAAKAGLLELAESRSELLRLHLRAPEGDPRVKALALDITRGAAGPEAKARAVEKYLRANYSYSLFSRGGGLEDFLFVTRSGNCEYFATAAALLLRHAGVPTRLVSGFLASEYNEYGRFYDVRQNQAHAWTEAYDGAAWVRLDATPALSGAQALRGRLYGRLSRWLEAGSVRWYRHVIGYDTYAQRNTFHRLGVAVSRLNLARALGRLAAAAAALLLLRAALAALRRRRSRRPALDLFARAQAALAAAGLPREPHWTPREYAEAVSRRRPDLAALRRLAELHYQERYAGRALDAAEAAEAAVALEELRRRAAGRR